MDQQKLAFVFYVTSSVALLYASLVNSPLGFSKNGWENSMTPATFFGIVAILILHIVFTGKMLSQEKYPKVKLVSTGIAALAGLILIPGVLATISMIPRLLGAFFS